MLPEPGGHVARIRELSPVRMQENRFGPGITPGYSDTGKVCQIIFDPLKYDKARALSWLDEQDYVPIEFLEFSIDSIREHEETREITALSPRTLSIPWMEAGGKLEKRPDGSLLVKGVKMLGAGTWTDSAKKTPLNYSEDVLKRNAGNWVDASHWSRHLGGVPRRVGEMIGKTINPRYEDGHVVADIEYHGLSQDSRDTIAMIEAGVANFVSVEHGGRERWNVGTKQYEAEELFFTGSATVNKGACQTCKIRENESVKEADSLSAFERKIRDALTDHLKLSPNKYDDYKYRRPWVEIVSDTQVIYEIEPQMDGNLTKYRIPYMIDGEKITFGESVEVEKIYKDKELEEPEMDTAELEKTITEQGNQIKELSEAVKALTAKLSEPNKELEARIDALEREPVTKTDVDLTKELEAPPFVINTERGEMRMVGA